MLHAGQCINEFIHSGARAHTHNFTRHHVLERRLAHQCFQIVLGKHGHGKNLSVGMVENHHHF